MEIGAAINVCPNAARILSYYEFNFTRAMPVTVEEVSCITLGVQDSFRSPNPCR